jgi:hypothetical protein
VQQGFGDLTHAVHGDAGALFDSERVVGGLELDEGTLADRAGVEVGLQIDGAGGVDRQLRDQMVQMAETGSPSARHVNNPPAATRALRNF